MGSLGHRLFRLRNEEACREAGIGLDLAEAERAFEEQLHPRDRVGKFAHKAGGSFADGAHPMVASSADHAEAARVHAKAAHENAAAAVAHGAISKGQDWRAAIAQYDADVKSGKIKFGPSGFADVYPGEAKSSAALAAHVMEHAPPGIAVPDYRTRPRATPWTRSGGYGYRSEQIERAFVEAEHPRDTGGKFSSKPGSGAVTQAHLEKVLGTLNETHRAEIEALLKVQQDSLDALKKTEEIKDAAERHTHRVKAAIHCALVAAGVVLAIIMAKATHGDVPPAEMFAIASAGVPLWAQELIDWVKKL